MSDKKQAANRLNSRKSTGPKTLAGKRSVSQNARQHGILSTHLFLENESREEFSFLLETLQQELAPVGLLENTLVERVAVSIWRQRRLVRSESAEVAMRQRLIDSEDFVSASNSLGISVSDTSLSEAINFPYRLFEGQNSKEIAMTLTQFAQLAVDKGRLDMELIRLRYPLAYDSLLRAQRGSLEALSAQFVEIGKGIDRYLKDFIVALRAEYDREQIREFASLYRDSAQLRSSVDLIGRYQSALDNELYKALKALREAQTWRLSRLEAEARKVDDSGEAA